MRCRQIKRSRHAGFGETFQCLAVKSQWHLGTSSCSWDWNRSSMMNYGNLWWVSGINMDIYELSYTSCQYSIVEQCTVTALGIFGRPQYGGASRTRSFGTGRTGCVGELRREWDGLHPNVHVGHMGSGLKTVEAEQCSMQLLASIGVLQFSFQSFLHSSSVLLNSAHVLVRVFVCVYIRESLSNSQSCLMFSDFILLYFAVDIPHELNP